MGNFPERRIRANGKGLSEKPTKEIQRLMLLYTHIRKNGDGKENYIPCFRVDHQSFDIGYAMERVGAMIYCQQICVALHRLVDHETLKHTSLLVDDLRKMYKFKRVCSTCKGQRKLCAWCGFIRGDGCECKFKRPKILCHGCGGTGVQLQRSEKEAKCQRTKKR